MAACCNETKPRVLAMRKLKFLFLFFVPCELLAQQSLPDTFKVGNYLEVFHTDSIKIYFNCTGAVVDKRCAAFYRVGKIDRTIINLAGPFTDYFMDGTLALQATMKNNMLEGEAVYYYASGQIKEKGQYQAGLRLGKWTYFYPNGNIEKVMEFRSDDLLVWEAYTDGGKVLVNNGKGRFTTQFSNTKQCTPFETQGEVVAGRKTGDWQFSNLRASVPIAIESYTDGKFLKGVSGRQTYYEGPKIHFNSFTANEAVLLLDNHIGCPGESINLLQYRGSGLQSKFYKELAEEFSAYTLKPDDQWLVVGISIGKGDDLQSVNVASSINDTALESFVKETLLKKKSWKASQINGRKGVTDLFFSVLVDVGQIIIPIEYVFRNHQ